MTKWLYMTATGPFLDMVVLLFYMLSYFCVNSLKRTFALLLFFSCIFSV